MPLDKSGSISALHANIGELIKSGRPNKQAVAIAFDTQRKSGGKIAPPKPKKTMP